MKKGKIITQQVEENTAKIKGEFYIDFQNGRFGPYTHIFDRERLYFHEDVEERGSFFFPLRSKEFKNTEIFLETNDIVIGVGKRGSFSEKSKRFVEIINLKTKQKYRFYPEEVSLIYNEKDEIVVYYKKSEKYKKLSLSKNMLEKESEISHHTEAFFKLLYNSTTEKYSRLVYKANSTSHKAGYFTEESINTSLNAPKSFQRDIFQIRTLNSKYIDIWEASLTGEL